jgi:hypothetical protein
MPAFERVNLSVVLRQTAAAFLRCVLRHAPAAQAQDEVTLLMAQRKMPHPELGAKRHVEGRNAVDPACAE